MSGRKEHAQALPQKTLNRVDCSTKSSDGGRRHNSRRKRPQHEQQMADIAMKRIRPVTTVEVKPDMEHVRAAKPLPANKMSYFGHLQREQTIRIAALVRTKTLLADCGGTCQARLWTDSSASLAISTRQGFGNVRHVDLTRRAFYALRMIQRHGTFDSNGLVKHYCKWFRITKIVRNL